MGNSSYIQIETFGHVLDEMSGYFTLNGGVGCQDNLDNLTFFDFCSLPEYEYFIALLIRLFTAICM